MRRALLAASAVVVVAAAAPRPGAANPWTRDQGKFYLNLSYGLIFADAAYGADFQANPLPARYLQHQLGLYGEVGLVSRWLTAMVDLTLLRHASLADQRSVYGFGDLRVGLWSGLVASPVRLAIGVIVGFPTGDPAPSAGPGDLGAQQIATALPTGDGEYDAEFVASFGHSFGGGKRYPLQHYVVLTVGYWLRTKPRAVVSGTRRDFHDSVTWKAEIGTSVARPTIRNLWLALKVYGSESLVRVAEPGGLTGLGDGVSVVALGVDLFVRIFAGFGAGVGFATAFRARNLPAGPSLRFFLSYDRR